MKKIKNKTFRKNQKGLATLFITVYISLLAITLISTLFVSVSISSSSLTDYMKIEQDRMEESILLDADAGNLMVNSVTSNIEAILVNNTGGLAVRIRALYVDEKLVCDPSTLHGDSFIAPASSLWIQLTSLNPPLKLNSTTLNGQWIAVTEKGTKASALGSALYFGFSDELEFNPNKFYYGPILMIYDLFHWSNDSGQHWNSGWSIPNTNAGDDIIWRILIANIDNRTILFSNSCSFALIQNSQQQNKIAIWGVGPSDLNPPDLALKPLKYYFLYFSEYKGPAFSSLYSPNPITSNFITLTGNFRERNGTLTGFAQTIPFQAVLLTS